MRSILIALFLLNLLCSCKDFVNNKRDKNIKKHNRIICNELKNNSFEGTVDAVFLNENYDYKLRLMDGREVSIFPLEHSRHILKKGDVIFKPSGEFKFVIKPYINMDSSYVIKREDDFDCDYWDNLERLN